MYDVVLWFVVGFWFCFFKSFFSGFLDSRGEYREQFFLLVITLPHFYDHVSVVATLFGTN